MPPLKGFRFPRGIIAYAVWAYYRFALSTDDVKDLLAERGMVVSRETVRLWVNRFGPHFASCLKRDRPGAADKWHLDEVVAPITGVKYWLWRAVDTNGDVLDILVQPQRNAKAARRFLMRLVARFGTPRVLISDKLRSYVRPIRDLAPDADHRRHKELNNRIEGSHRPTRKREKIMGRFKSPRQAQRFLAAHDQIATIFRPRRYRLSATSYRHARADAFDLWRGAVTATSRVRRDAPWLAVRRRARLLPAKSRRLPACGIEWTERSGDGMAERSDCAWRNGRRRTVAARRASGARASFARESGTADGRSLTGC